MSRKSRRELERELADLKHTAGEGDAPTNVTVEWHVPDDPESANDGVRYDAEMEMLTFDLWHAQRECLDRLQSSDHDIVAFLGGYATGKSVLGARWLLAQALAHPGSRFLAMGKSFAEGGHSTFPKLFAQLPGEATRSNPERSPLVAEHTVSDKRLVLTTGAEIVLGSADTVNRYAGAEFGAIWLDEPSHYETDLHDLLEMLGSRLRGVDGPKVQCWTLTGNGYNDAWEILEKRRDATGEPLGLDIDVVRASTLENPFLEASERDRYERQFGGTERANEALHGEFAAVQGLVYRQFSRTSHVIPPAEAQDRIDDANDWRVYGYDAGWNDPRVMVELGKTAVNQLVVLDLFHETGSHVTDVIGWLEKNNKPQGPIYCEHEPSDIEKLTRAGYSAERAEKSIDTGIDEVRKRLDSDRTLPIRNSSSRQKHVVRHWSGNEWIQHLAESDNWIQDQPGQYRQKTPASESSTAIDDTAPADADGRVGLLVSEACTPLIQEFQSYKTDHVGKTGANDHCLDALRYAIMGVSS